MTAIFDPTFTGTTTTLSGVETAYVNASMTLPTAPPTLPAYILAPTVAPASAETPLSQGVPAVTSPPTLPAVVLIPTPNPTIVGAIATPPPAAITATSLVPTASPTAIGGVVENISERLLEASDRRLFADSAYQRGAYCGSWDSTGQDEWCYVLQAATCGKMPSPPDAADLPPAGMVASTGPCTDEVDQRSGLIESGFDIFNRCSIVAFVLGLLLLSLAACSFMVFQATIAAVHTTPHGDLGDLESRFERAQKEVMTKTKNSTPEATKLRIYGLYRQAVIGDATGEAGLGREEQQKYNAWAQHRGMPTVVAKEKYIEEAG